MTISNLPFVTVAMPAFNAARTLAVAIDAVLGQSYRQLELVVCDDASTDGTAEILVRLRDPRVRVIRNAKNSGEGVTRDNAIAAARGTWIAVIDADDAWHPQRLEKLLAAAGGREDCMVFDDLMTCHDTPEGLKAWRPIRGRSAFGAAGPGAREISLPAFLRADRLLIKPLVPRKAIVNHGIRHSRKRFGADTEYFLRLAHAGLGMIYVPEPLYYYRVTPGSATAAASTSAFRECIAECAGFGWDADVSRAFDDKIDTLRSTELMYELRARMLRGNVPAALGLLARHPRVWRSLPRRALRHFQYQVDRWRHGGAGR